MAIHATAGGPAIASGDPLDDRYDLRDGEVHLSGIQALVRLPLDQRRLDQQNGLDVAVFVSGYEGSPLAGLDLQLSRQKKRLAEHRVIFQPGVNEELAANAVQGTQIACASPDRIGDGVVGIWYGKAPGLDRATDAIRHSNLGGTHRSGGVLALVGDDSIAKSSTVPSSSETAIAELGMPCLSPADPQDILELGLHGIAMSRASGLWVAMKLATNVVDGSGMVRLDPARVRPVTPDTSFDGKVFEHVPTGHLLQPTLGKLEATQVRQRLELARRYSAANHLNRITGDQAAKLGIVCAGATYLDVRQALSDIGITDAAFADSRVRVLKLGMIHPLEPGIIDTFSAGLRDIVVVEEKKAFIELALKDILYGRPEAPRIVGKRDEHGRELFRADGDLPADYIATRLAPRIRDHGGPASVTEWLERRTARRIPTLLPILPRRPSFCSGCPHNSSTKVPDGSLVGAGIGCHALVAFMPEDRIGESIGHSQMGGEGAAWIGMAPFVTRDHLFQNLGDGTYHHSGSLAVRAAVASGAHITYKLLYNDAVAMTGGQQAIGKMAVPQIVAELLAEGVAHIAITSDQPKQSRRAFGRRLPARVSIRHRDEMITVQEELAQTAGVTVLIHQQECATELRRKRKRGLVESPNRRIFINERVCEGCGDCGDKSGCLSVRPTETEFGRKTEIHQASCNLDFSCLKGDCPSFIEVIPRKASHRRFRRQSSAATKPKPEPTPTPTLPAPQLRVTAEDFSMRITGVGGTGVVTVAQVIAAAASHAGLQVKGLDQLGLAQKGGAVVSDIRMSTSKISGANKIGPGGCDLYLGCDILVAATETNLAVMAPDRTYAVVSTSITPTGQMVTDTATLFPAIDDLTARIEWSGARPENIFVDAHAVTGTAALDEDQYDNIFLLGVAVQSGVIPLSPEDVEWALDLNGVQVERNLAAFRLGRQHVADGGSAVDTSPAPSALGALIQRRADELTAYQDDTWATRYTQHVDDIRRSEAAAIGESTAITEAFARHLFKVMAYKDEYEVARLHLDPILESQIRDEFGDGASYSILLHPPLLRAMGLKNKIRLQAWRAKPALQVLYRLRKVRGTRLDIFGYDGVRREERRLIEDYTEAMATAMTALSPTTYDAVLEMAGLPELVRGYESLKMESLKKYQSRRAAILQELTTQRSHA
ncbi:indolepyruvate ferredoxin oxidoreductase family protein [Mycolicibacterium baixiangningiae]|uniref:indolepyruvate ferredoxin oxidoreductase family protein n=1 Tax=Mycolicibacterium baixiangningiae TaxID=2761578 RepID=UPI00186806B5|nr:indolepyruvate ferredoxin oxidoreductase family protein [Mycolicibacterium baixiangningiae]